MQRKSIYILSSFFSIFFLLLSYWATNLGFPISGEKLLLSRIEMVRGYFKRPKAHFTDSVLFINVTYDKELRPITDKNGIALGYAPVTNRQKLLRLLEYLNKKDDYKYILLDVFFPKRIHTKWDEELFETILSMPRIVIPCHSDEAIADERLMKKAGLADYITTYSESDFVKYPYFTSKQKSIPVKMYEEMTGRDIKKHGPFYTDGCRLVRSSIVLTFDIKANTLIADNRELIWHNLGMNLLGDSIPELKAQGDSLLYVPNKTSDKYIIIGAYNGDDSHATFLGEESGAVILFNAYISLLHGHHVISISLFVILFATFFILSYLALSRRHIKDVLQTMIQTSTNRWKRRVLKVLNWLCSWIGLSVFLSILCVLTYLFLGEAYDILITSTAFYLFNLIITFFSKFINNKTKA